MITLQDIRRTDYSDRITHPPEQRLFAQILFADDPAREAKVLNEIPVEKLSGFGKRVRSMLIELKKKGDLDQTHIQSVFVGRGHAGLFQRWFFTIMAAGPSTVQWPFEPEEITQ
jgi:hypothetical protein